MIFTIKKTAFVFILILGLVLYAKHVYIILPHKNIDKIELNFIHNDKCIMSEIYDEGKINSIISCIHGFREKKLYCGYTEDVSIRIFYNNGEHLTICIALDKCSTYYIVEYDAYIDGWDLFRNKLDYILQGYDFYFSAL